LTDDVNGAFFMPESGLLETLNCEDITLCFPSAKVVQLNTLVRLLIRYLAAVFLKIRIYFHT
jgi:hypothetical protein